MQELIPHSRRHWRMNGQLVSLELKGGGIIKPLERFPDHCYDENLFGGFLENCYSKDITRPSSYADLFYQKSFSPKLKWSYNALFMEWFVGGWQEAKKIGVLPGHWNMYDMKSAYFWALTQGLPDTRTFRFKRKYKHSELHGFDCEGLFVIEIEKARETYPYPFNRKRQRYIATTEEIEQLELSVTKIHSGITWKKSSNVANQMVDTILGLPASKQVGRSYWGRWASRAPISCRMASGREWKLRNILTNIIWAHIILSRVKMRVWRHSGNAAHIFVDSIITKDIIETGNEAGDWKLVNEFDGLNIKSPGYFETLDGTLIKHSGRILN